MLMTLSTLLHTWFTYPHDKTSFHCSNNEELALSSIDSFFTIACAIYTHQTSNENENDIDTLRILAKGVYRLYIDVYEKLKNKKFRKGNGNLWKLFHISRLVPFCQLYYDQNKDNVREILNYVSISDLKFTDTMKELRGLYHQQFQMLMASHLNGTRKNEATKSVLMAFDISSSLQAMVASENVMNELLFVPIGSNARDYFSAPDGLLAVDSLLTDLILLYERDLPTFQNELSQHSMTVFDIVDILARTRKCILYIIQWFIDAVTTSNGSSGDLVFSLLHVMSTVGPDENEPHTEKGCVLNDLWYSMELNTRIKAFFEQKGMDYSNIEYLEMIIDSVPRRKVLNQQQLQKTEDKSTYEEVNTVRSNLLPSMEYIEQVRDVLPHLGKGFVALCLLVSNNDVESVIHFLLEENIPPVLLNINQDLQLSDPNFPQIEHSVRNNEVVDAKKPDHAARLDPTKVWIGKKEPREVQYDPKVASSDPLLTDKFKEIVNSYEQSELDRALGIVDLPEVLQNDEIREIDDEYENEYDDEYDDFSYEDGESYSSMVKDSGGLEDMDLIREQNRRIRVKEEEVAYWESMRNPNIKRLKEEYNSEGEESISTATGVEKSDNIPRVQSNSTNQSEQPSNVKYPNPSTTVGPRSNQKPKNTKKNKGKTSNHNRKDRALRKQK